MSNPATPEPTYTAEQIFSLLTRQPFADFNSNEFEEFIAGGDGTRPLDELREIAMTKLKQLLECFAK